MSSLLAILKKELVDNLRDKRAFFFALVYGPVILPLMMIGPLIFGVKTTAIDFEKTSPVYVSGLALAPNLIEFLSENNLEAKPAPKNYLEQIKNESLDLVLEVDASYALQLSQAKPALLILHFNSKKKSSEKKLRQVKIILNRYEKLIANKRMYVRGIDTSVFDVLNLIEHDQFREAGGTQYVARFLPFILIFSMTMGGFYLATDIFPGEREKLTLESLLSLPVTRAQLIIAKAGAISIFVLFSCILASFSFFVIIKLIPVEKVGDIFDYNILDIAISFTLVSPLALFMTALMVLIASIARSTKEAQTQLGIMMVVPMLPMFLLEMVHFPAGDSAVAIPILGQYLLLERVGAGDSLDLYSVFLASASTFLLSLIIAYGAVKAFQRDSILS